MTLMESRTDHQPTHRGTPTNPEQGPPTQFPEDDRCWAAYQGRRCSEHSGGAR